MTNFRHAALSSLLAAALCASLLPAQAFRRDATSLPETSDKRVDYTMRVSLQPESKTLRGSQTITYRNRTQRATSELRFHMYLNAFRNIRSTHLREESPAARARYKSDDEFGSIRFLELRLLPASAEGGAAGQGQAEDLLPKLRYVQPDDDNLDDRTVVSVALPRPLEAGGSITIETEFLAKLPKAYRRTGWGPGRFFMLAQWFPKLGVLQDPPASEPADADARWYCHQFHAHTEFFADFGRYDVTIETPAGWPVGATGKQVGETRVDGARASRRFVQEDVHDFAWVTDPDYRVHEWLFRASEAPEDPVSTILARELKLDPAALALRDVKVRFLLHPEHDTEEQLARHRRAVRESLVFFGRRFGAYPYETLTVVDPCTDLAWKRLGGGMEYPTLITCGSRYLLHPQRLQPEGVTVHEFGHQFWYGLSANNEPEEPWLDEGLCSYCEGRAQDLAYASLRRAASGAAADAADHVGNPVLTTEFGPLVFGGVAPARVSAGGSRPWSELVLLRKLPIEDLLVTGVDRMGLSTKGLRSTLKTLRYDGTLVPDLPITRALRELPFLTYETERSFRNLWSDRQRYLQAPSKDPVRRAAWKFLDRQSYRTNAYPRPASVLATLERMMGPNKWWPCLRRFHERARFAHPTGDDFVATVREFGGDEIASFAREALTTTKILDYGIESVVQGDEPARKGLFDEDERKDTKRYARVVVRNYGQLRAAVPVRFHFGDLSTEDRLWPVEAQREQSWIAFEFSPRDLARRGGALVRVEVDPPLPDVELGQVPIGRLVLDANLLNNGWSRVIDTRPARRRAIRMMLWIESVMAFFGVMG